MTEINIPIKKDYLPINLTSESDEKIVKTFRFYYNDDYVRNYEKNGSKLISKVKKIDVSDKDDFARNDLILKEAFDFYLGKGSYEGIKELQPVLIHRREMLLILVENIEKAMFEMNKAQDEREANYYLVEK